MKAKIIVGGITGVLVLVLALPYFLLWKTNQEIHSVFGNQNTAEFTKRVEALEKQLQETTTTTNNIVKFINDSIDAQKKAQAPVASSAPSPVTTPTK